MHSVSSPQGPSQTQPRFHAGVTSPLKKLIGEQYVVHYEHGKLLSENQFFEPEEEILVRHDTDPPYKASIVTIQRHEILIKRTDGLRAKIYLSHLRTGRCKLFKID